MAVSNYTGLVIPNPQVGIQLTKVTDSPSDWSSVANSTYFYDKTDKLVYFKNSSGAVVDLFSGNIYNSDGTLTADRTVSLLGNDLTFADNGTGRFTVNSDDGVNAVTIDASNAGGVSLSASSSSGGGAVNITTAGVNISGYYSLPNVIPSAGQVLTAGNSGTTSWQYPISPSEIFRGFTFNNNSTTVQTDGGLTASASASTLAQAVSGVDFDSKQIRLRYYASVVSTGRYTGLRGSALLWFIHGGFRFVCDFNISDTAFSSNCQQFYGLAGQTTDLGYAGVSLVQVSTLTNLIGLGSDAADTNLQIIHNDATGTATKIDLGVGFPANRTAGAAMTTVYTIMLYNAPASTNVIYKITNNETGAIAQGVITSDLPATSQGLNLFASRAMGAAVTNTGQFDLSKLGCYSLL